MIYEARLTAPNYYLEGGSSKAYPITKQKKKTWKGLELNNSNRAYPSSVRPMADMITQTIEPHEYPDNSGERI